MVKSEKGAGPGASALGIGLALAATCVALLAPSAAQAVPPTIVQTGVAAVTTTSARLEASINPNARATTYRFEYGPDECGSNPCTSLPVPEGKITAGSEPVQVSVSVEGLAPGTSRHFRVIAKSGGTGGGETISPDRVFATYLEPQAFGPCPNDLFRTENPAAARIERSSALLADCRAYERASPRDKNGGDVTGIVPLARAGASGGKISFVSTTGVPGGVGSQEFPAYLAGRDAAGWSTEGLLPPAEAGQNALVLGWTPDFEEVFSKATRFGEPTGTAFLMTPAGGTPIRIADYAPEMRPSFAGASTGAAAVLFESKDALPGVQGAIEGRPNLYLWERASGRLLLAGVLNDEEAPAKGAFAGPFDWAVGETLSALSVGGAAANYYTQEEHAISADGRAVYFTAAATGKLYVRLNPAAPQSALDGEGGCTEPQKACTVEVSASQKTNGPGGGPDPAGARPAAFQAASADGTAAFFTSPEKLTDDANTGPEQEPAAIEQADLTAEDPQDTVASCVPAHALGVAVDSEHIYWVDPSTEAIGRANLDCTGAEPVFVETGAVEYEEEIEPGIFETTLVPSTPRYLAVDGGHIYWTNTGRLGKHGEPLKEKGTIGRADLNGNPASVEPDFIRGASDPQGIAVGGEHIYWANSLQLLCFEGTGCNPFWVSIGRADIGGENPNEAFIQDNPNSDNDPPQSLAVDSSHIFWVSGGPGQGVDIHRRDLSGDAASEVLKGVDSNTAPRGLAIDASHLYLAEKGANRIVRANLDLEERELEWIKEAGHPFGVAVAAGGRLLWSSNGEANPNPGNDLYRYREGTLEDIALDSASEAGADVQGVLGASEDGTYVYYAANGVPDGVTNSPNARGETAMPGDCRGPRPIDASTGSCNLYLWHEDPATHAQSTTFVARLEIDGNQLKSDATDWAPRTALFLGGSNFEKTSRVTPDGRTLLFRSQRRLTAYDSEGTPQFYRYRAGATGPICVSCDPTGMAPAGAPQLGPRLGSISTAVVAPATPASLVARNLSADGDSVFFETTEALVGEDTNGAGGCAPTGLQGFPSCLDVYEWEAQGSGACTAEEAVAQGGCLYLLSTGKGADPALFADASADGNDIFFFTRSRLVGDDEDQLMDLYDARVGGGLAAQNTALPPPPCEGEASCKAQATAPPATASPGSASFTGPGNQPAQGKPRCPKGKRAVKRHGRWRCVAKKHRRAHRHRRRGAGKGRAGR